MGNKTLSVVVPAYNVEKYLMQCIGSLLVPEFLDEVEIIIVNDGSTDDTGRIAEAYQNQYPETVRVINKSNGGHGSAINVGIEEACGTYFRVVDGDDWVDSRTFAQMIAALKKADADVVATRYTVIQDATGEEQSGDPYDIYHHVSCDKEYRFEDICHLPYIRIHQLNYRTSVLRESGVRLDEFCYYVDVEYALLPMKCVKTVRFLDLDVYCYRVGRAAQSMNIEYMRRYVDNHQRVLDRIFAFYDECKSEGRAPLVTYLESELARLVVTQTRIWLSFPAAREYKETIVALGARVKKEYPQVAKKLPNRAVRWLFATRGFGYSLISLAVRRRYRSS